MPFLCWGILTGCISLIFDCHKYDNISLIYIYIYLHSLSTGPEDMDRHPERRMKAAFLAYEEANMSRLKQENPNMRLSQLKQQLKKEWTKSPENPLNQRFTTYNSKWKSLFHDTVTKLISLENLIFFLKWELLRKTSTRQHLLRNKEELCFHHLLKEGDRAVTKLIIMFVLEVTNKESLHLVIKKSVSILLLLEKIWEKLIKVQSVINNLLLLLNTLHLVRTHNWLQDTTHTLNITSFMAACVVYLLFKNMEYYQVCSTKVWI